MERLPKLNESVYIVVAADMGGINIVKGRVCGVREFDCAFTKYLFNVETALGYYDRFALDMYESVEEIANNIKNFVME